MQIVSLAPAFDRHLQEAGTPSFRILTEGLMDRLLVGVGKLRGPVQTGEASRDQQQQGAITPRPQLDEVRGGWEKFLEMENYGSRRAATWQEVWC